MLCCIAPDSALSAVVGAAGRVSERSTCSCLASEKTIQMCDKEMLTFLCD